MYNQNQQNTRLLLNSNNTGYNTNQNKYGKLSQPYQDQQELETQKNEITNLKSKIQQMENQIKNYQNTYNKQEVRIQDLNSQIATIQQEKTNYKKQTEQLKKEIENSNNNNKYSQNQINSLQKDVQQKESQIRQLEDQIIPQLQKTITFNQNQIVECQSNLETCKNQYLQQVNELQSENEKQINILKKENSIINQKNQLQINNLQKEVDELKKQNQVNIDIQNEQKQQIVKYQSEITNLQFQKNDQYSKYQQELKKQNEENQKKQDNLEKQYLNEKIQFEEKTKEAQQQELYKIKQQLSNYQQEYDIQNQYKPQIDVSKYGYDIIISMKSVLDLQNKELDQIFHNQNDSQIKQDVVSVKIYNHEKIFDNNLIVVGMQGQRNQGKTFLLNSLINENFPSEFYVNTPGICMKYHNINGRNIIYVDSEGSNGPVQIDYEKNEHYQNLIRNQQNSEYDDKSIQLVNKYVTQKHQYQKVTEQMQQEFVISNSHILIIMLTNITQEDVNLIHSIQSYLKKEKNSTKKRIFVMHNLKDFRRQECIEKYIQSLKTLFPLRQQQITTFNKPLYQYNSVFIDTIYKNVNHLFMACQKSQAGEFYNKFALDYLKEEIAQFKGEIKFNAAEKFQEYLKDNIKNYLTLKMDDQKKANTDFFEFNQEHKIIQLKKNYQIDEPKELQMNIFGYIQREFSYSIVKKELKLYLLVDIPGSVKVDRHYKKSEGLFTLEINQKEQLEQTLGETIISTRKHDKTVQMFKICGKDKLYNLVKDECKDLKNGIHQFVFSEELDDDDEED